MNRLYIPLFLTVLLATLVTGCSPAPSPLASGPGQQGAPAASQAALQHDALDSYSAEFQIQFSGASSWSYLLTTRKSPELREISLHLEGLPPAKNPGDIRLVTDGVQSWMTGPATEGQCIQFPNQQGMDPNFLYPEALVSLQQAGAALQLVGEEAGDPVSSGSPVTLQHYQASGAETGPWKNAAIDIWQEKDSLMLRQFSMQAEGQDPYFSAGEGRLTAHYQAGALGDQPIQPVPGCEISVRLPESAGAFVRLPDMASFETPNRVEEIRQFYQSIMPQDGWVESEPPALVDGTTVLSYSRPGESVKITIQALPAGGSQVKLLFAQGD